MKIAVCYFGNTGGKKGSFGQGGFMDPSYCLNENINNLNEEFLVLEGDDQSILNKIDLDEMNLKKVLDPN